MSVGQYNNQGFNKYALTLDATGDAVESEVIDQIFKKWYEPSVRDVLNNKRILSRIMNNKTDIPVGGEEFIWLLRTGRNFGGGSYDDQGDLPDPMKQRYQQIRYRPRYNAWRILVGGPAMAAARSDRGAFTQILDSEIRGATVDFQVMINRIRFGDGSGRLCRVVATSGTTYTADSPGGPSVSNYGLGTQYLAPGMRVVIWRDAGGTLTFNPLTVGAWESYFILDVNYAAGTFTLASHVAPTVAATLTDAPSAGTPWFMSIANVFSTAVQEISTGIMNEQFGLSALVSDIDPYIPTFGEHGPAPGTPYDLVGGLVSATYPQAWQSFIVDNGGTPMPFAQDLFQQAMDGLDQLGDGSVKVWITTHGIRRQYVNSLIANKRYVNTMKLDGGFTAVEYDERPLIPDKDCMRGRAYGLDTDVLHDGVCADFHWMDRDGHVLHRLQDKDMFQACLLKYWQFCTDARNRNCAVLDIADS